MSTAQPLPDRERRGPDIRRFHPADRAPGRLACFPHAGGSASYFYPLSRRLSPGTDVLAVQYPGRQDLYAEPPLEDARELAELIAPRLAPWCDRPLALFGHSYGATVAFEVALRLQEEHDCRPLALFASGRRAPSRFRPGERTHLGTDEQLVATIARLNGTDTAVFAENGLLRLVLPAVRADYKAAETYRYRPGPPLECPVVVLNGTADPQVNRAEAAAWAEHTAAGCTQLWFDGGHFYLDQHQDALVTLLTSQLAGDPR